MRLVESETSATELDLSFYFNSTSKSNRIFGWFELVINSVLPFSFLDKPILRRHVKHESTSTSTFNLYLPNLTQIFETKIAQAVPSQFVLIFDGWSIGATHYLALFASLPSKKSKGYSLPLLTFYPMGMSVDLMRLNTSTL